MKRRFARREDLGLSKGEFATLARLSTPQKIQNYLNALPQNFEPDGQTCLSVREVLHQKRAHCIEGAMLAALALWIQGEPPLLLDLKATRDYDHVVALFRRGGHWGAISKTNPPLLRYRDPVYRTLRELAMSYFHEYANRRHQKTLRSWAGPFDLAHATGWTRACRRGPAARSCTTRSGRSSRPCGSCDWRKNAGNRVRSSTRR